MSNVPSVSSIADFGRFRFMRGENGELAEIPSPTPGERLFLVLDCQRFQIARLHIFEAGDEESSSSAGRFRSEMKALSRLEFQGLNSMIAFGEDDSELYYANPVIDGESLPDYLEQTGPLQPAIAMRLVLQLVAILECRKALPRALENFSPADFFLRENRTGGLDLVFADFGGWSRNEVEGPEGLIERVGLLFYSLLAGQCFDTPPYILFDTEAKETPESLRELIKVALRKKRDAEPIKNLVGFQKAARDVELSLELSDEIPAPRRFVRDWLLDGQDGIDLGSNYRPFRGQDRITSLDPNLDYAFDAEPVDTVSFNGVRFQLFPGEQSIPRDGWLEQHRCALRHPGRGRSNQIRIAALVPQGRCLLIGEERTDSLNLTAIVDQHGPLEIRHALELGNKLNAALDSIERTVGASPIWWLPPENTRLVTGNQGIAGLREALNRYGTRAWHHLPLRLQLHQTLPSLIHGIDLPDSLLDRMQSGPRNGDPARRSAVLLPLLCFAITGHSFRWNRPLTSVDGVPGEIISLLESTRKALVDDPDSERGRLLDRIASSLAGEPIPAFMLAELDGPPASENLIVDDSLSGFETVANGVQRSAQTDFTSLAPIGSTLGGEISDSSDTPQPVKKAEPLGVIDDDEFWEFGVEGKARPVGAEIPPAPELNANVEPSEPSEPQDEVDGFGERLLVSPANADESESDEPEAAAAVSSPNPVPWSRVFALSLLLGVLIVGSIWAAGGLSSWASRKSLSEDTFPSTHYPEMKTTRPDPSRSTTPPAAAGSASPGVSQVPEAGQALKLARQSLESEDYPEAVGLLIRTLDLDPASSEARSRLESALDAWREAGVAPVPPGRAFASIDQRNELAPRAIWALAEFHRSRDPALHLHWLTRSANGGYAPHQRELGLILSRVPEEISAAAEWFRKAADGGDTEAQFHYGECLVFGKGVPRDVNLAIDRYLTLSAEAGDGRALELLGVCYAKGDGVTTDPRRAHTFFQRAVEAGNIEAYYNLAVRYAKGDGVPKSETEAARLFGEGAAKGDPACMYAFGRCLEAGFGVTKNLALATSWIRKSAELDFDDARAWCGLNGILLARKNGDS